MEEAYSLPHRPHGTHPFLYIKYRYNAFKKRREKIKTMGFWDITAGLLQSAGNAAYSQFTASQQFERQKQLMDLQLENQRSLNQQGRDIQMDIWNKTNYAEQIKQLKAAGLNASLLYGKGGQGGVTGSQSGGSAASGSASQAPMIDLAALNFAKTQAEVELLEAQAENQQSQAEANRGYLKDQSVATTGNLKQTYELIGAEIGTEQAKKLNIEADTVLKNIDAYIKDKTKENQIELVNEQLKQLENINNNLAIEIMMKEKDLARKDELLDQLIEQNNLNIAMTKLQMEATKKGMQMTEGQITKMRNEIAQGWKQLNLQEDQLELTKDGQEITKRGQNLDYKQGIFGIKMNAYNQQQMNKTVTKIAHINGVYGLGKEVTGALSEAYTAPMKAKAFKPVKGRR